MEITGLILAGGLSTRFGSDKASAVVAGKPMLQWVVAAIEGVCERVVVVRAKGQVLPDVVCLSPVSVVEDVYEAMGPLAGLVAGFSAIDEGVCFATSCDAPLLRGGLVPLLAGQPGAWDIVAPVVEGRVQPLNAVYRVERCLPVFRAQVERGALKVTSAYSGLGVVRVGEDALRMVDAELASFRNANRLEDVAAMERELRARRA